ncbi:exopolyphosphatase [Staphylococcus microti]|uniref:exopolyphosphatase n=1 Tax=Staphylococcus microti TaxID=569857 RepID=A0A0D6XUA9_9STAP|nr:exopolyphosphatase [Staphylococcus microti]KIX91423.1 exopolyphosphatase [Staphylococcus microti]PNZ80213.1 exopolyphosphatase [Staphylococcus microti]SUM57859.1 putative exopolyphosphatase [Staphylococcus microti]
MERNGLIDIGSNTIRLVIFEFDHETGLNEIQNIKTPARLSQYLDDAGNMQEDGIDVLVTALQSFKKVAEAFEVTALHPIATAAIRQSKNRDAIIARVKQEVDIDIILIPEEDEAFYGSYAVTHTTDIQDGVTVDIGGGSTELTYFKNKKIKQAISFPFGVVTLTRMFFEDKPHNDKEALKKMEKFLKKSFSKAEWIVDKAVPLVGIGGSARNCARIHQALRHYPIAGVHGYTMSHEDLTEVYDTLKAYSRDELVNLDGLSRDRMDIIVPAVVVFNVLYNMIQAEAFTFSRKGIREGFIMHQVAKTHRGEFKKENVQSDALRHLANEYKIEPSGAMQRQKLAEALLKQLTARGKLKIDETVKKRFLQAAYLYYLGKFIDFDSSSQHTYYIIANSSINGLSHKERVRLALLTSFKNKSLLKQYSDETHWFSDDELSDIQALGGIIKFVNALNISNTNTVNQVELTTDASQYQLNVYYQGEPIAEIYQSNRQKKHIEKILKNKLNIQFIKI